MAGFDPDAAALPGSGIFGLPHGAQDAAVLLMPVPFDATTSYRAGAARGPELILAASHQVDLFDTDTGRPYKRGIHLLPPDPEIVSANETARALAEPLIQKGGGSPSDMQALAEVERAQQLVNAKVHGFAAGALARDQLPGVVGGDHSVPYGAIQAAAEQGPIGILHVDAHADLRRAYEGFEWSHASIMENVLRKVSGVERLVQVGIRDVGQAEMALARGDDRVQVHHMMAWRRRMAAGESYLGLCQEAVAELPGRVWVSFDIDGLDPSLCPGTGTPVPGGLLFHEACLLLEALVEAHRTIVGFDLCEVSPGPVADGDGDAQGQWDGNVGARILYKLCGFGLLSR